MLRLLAFILIDVQFCKVSGQAYVLESAADRQHSYKRPLIIFED